MQTRRFLITGGSQGIGAALVSHARQAGHSVVFTGRNQGQIDAVAGDTGAHGVAADVSVDADNARVVDACLKQMGGIDMQKMRALFGTNVFGMVDLTNRVAPLLKAQGAGDIVNIASTSGTKGAKGATVYAGSKWAVRGISQCWQAELRPFGIRVMCILPSEVQTNWMGRTGRNNPNKLFAKDIAATIFAGLDQPRNVLWPEVAVFANNPWKED